MITCNLIRPDHTLWTVPAVVRKMYKKIWKHGGEFEAPPGEIKRVWCMKTSGVWVLNTVCFFFPLSLFPPHFFLYIGCFKKKNELIDMTDG